MALFSDSKVGFTLLEVLVAMAILATALVGLVSLHNRSLQLTIRTDRLSTATLLAQEMLTRTQLEGLRARRQTSGDFSELYPDQYHLASSLGPRLKLRTDFLLKITKNQTLSIPDP